MSVLPVSSVAPGEPPPVAPSRSAAPAGVPAAVQPAAQEARPAFAEPLAGRLAAVRGILAGLDGAVVAFSGGVDSTVLAYLAQKALGARALACTAVSPSLPGTELAAARELAARIGIRHRVIETRELELEAYARNDPDRCYVCKGVLFVQLRAVARAEGLGAILYGANIDDAADYRPGGRAAVKAGARAPLAEAGLSKADVRTLARTFGLPNAEKPAAPCLATRIPYGQRVTLEKLRQLEAAEAVVRRFGFRDLRVRHHLDVARLEVPLEQLGLALQPDVREALVRELRALGFRYVTLDLEGFRSGSLNAGLADVGRAASSAVGAGPDGQGAPDGAPPATEA